MKTKIITLTISALVVGLFIGMMIADLRLDKAKQACQDQIEYYLDSLSLQESELEQVYDDIYRLRDSVSKIEPKVETKYYPKIVERMVDTTTTRVYTRAYGKGSVVVLDTLIVKGQILGEAHEIYNTAAECIVTHDINCVESVGVNETLVSVERPQVKTLGFFERLIKKVF